MTSEFYKRFFSAVETILGEMRIREADDDPATEPAQESTAQEAGQRKFEIQHFKHFLKVYYQFFWREKEVL